MKKPLVWVVVLVLLAAGAFVARQRAQQREEQEDKAIVDYVYDEMLPGLALETAKHCPLPSRELAAVLHVVTADGGIQLGKLDLTPRPPAWTDEVVACVDQQFQGFSKRPPILRVPGGREYEVDLQLTFPPPGMQ